MKILLDACAKIVTILHVSLKMCEVDHVRVIVHKNPLVVAQNM